MSGFLKLINDIEKTQYGDEFEFVAKLNALSPKLEQAIKTVMKKSCEDALQKLLYFSFRFPWIITHPLFQWYPQIYNKTLKTIGLQKGDYRDKLAIVLKGLSVDIKKDKALAKRKGQPIKIKKHIIRLIQGNILRLEGTDTLSDFRSYFRAKKHFKGKIYPFCKDCGILYNHETGEFDKKEDEYLWNVYYWLDVGLRLGYLNPNDTDEIISIFTYEDSANVEAGKVTYNIPNDKFIKIKDMIKTFLEQNYNF